VEADFSAALDQLTDPGGAGFQRPTSVMPVIKGATCAPQSAWSLPFMAHDLMQTPGHGPAGARHLREFQLSVQPEPGPTRRCLFRAWDQGGTQPNKAGFNPMTSTDGR